MALTQKTRRTHVDEGNDFDQTARWLSKKVLVAENVYRRLGCQPEFMKPPLHLRDGRARRPMDGEFFNDRARD